MYGWLPEINGHVAYVLMSKKGTFYKGYTAHFKERMIAHFRKSGGCYHTKRNPPAYVYHYEVFCTEKEARKREAFFKTIEGFHWLLSLQQSKKIIPYGTSAVVPHRSAKADMHQQA